MASNVRKILKRVALAIVSIVLVAAIVIGVKVLRFFTVDSQKLDEKLLVFTGGGGNTAVLITQGGLVVVDTKMWLGASRLHDRIAELGKVRAIINTHHHVDHTHGNPLFPPGTDVYAAAPVNDLLRRFDGSFWQKEPARSLMPNKPFQGTTELTFEDEPVRLVQLPPSHTGGGDIAVLFVRHGVVHTGDIVTTGIYPNIDIESGGSVRGCIAAADEILKLTFDTVVPGHGAVGKRDDVEKMRAYYAALWDHAKVSVAAAKSPSEAEKSAPASLLGRENIMGLTSLGKNLRVAMDEVRRTGGS